MKQLFTNVRTAVPLCLFLLVQAQVRHALLQQKLPEVTIKFCSSQDLNEIVKTVKELQPKEILVLENTRYFNIDA